MTSSKSLHADEPRSTKQSQPDGQHVLDDRFGVPVAHLLRHFVDVGEQRSERGFAHVQGHDLGDVEAHGEHPKRRYLPPQRGGSTHRTGRPRAQAHPGDGQAKRKGAVPAGGQECADRPNGGAHRDGQGQPMEGDAWFEPVQMKVAPFLPHDC